MVMYSARIRMETGKIVLTLADNGNSPVITGPVLPNRTEMPRPGSKASNVRVIIIPAEVQVNPDPVGQGPVVVDPEVAVAEEGSTMIFQ